MRDPVLAFLLVGLMALGSTGIVPSASAASAPAAVALTLNGVVAHETPDFWGTFVDGTSISPIDVTLLNDTPIKYLRFGANQIDEENWSNGCMYVPGASGGVCDSEQENPLAFATLCKEIPTDFCELGLPAEINDPNVDTGLMWWLWNHDGHWWPSCWAIGNEPEDWNDFNTPWALWTTATNVVATAAQFALDVSNVTDAVRHADPGACIVGIESNGQPSQLNSWVGTLLTSVTNLTRIAYHIDPAINTCTTQTIARWLVPPDLSEIALGYRDASPVAQGLPIGVDEFHLGCVTGNESDAVFVGAGIAQALEDGISDVLYFRFDCGDSLCLLNTTGGESTVYTEFAGPLEHMEIDSISNVTLTGANPDTYAAWGSNDATHGSLLFANANATLPENVSLAGLAPPNWTADLWLQSTGGVVTESTVGSQATVAVPAQGMAVVAFSQPASSNVTGSTGPSPNSTGNGSSAPLSPDQVCDQICSPVWGIVLGGVVLVVGVAWLVSPDARVRGKR